MWKYNLVCAQCTFGIDSILSSTIFWLLFPAYKFCFKIISFVYFRQNQVTSGFLVFSDLNCNVIDLLRESDAATFSPLNEFEVLKKEESCLLVKDTYDNSDWKQQIVACMIHSLRSRTIVNFCYCFLKLHICMWRIDLGYENTALYAVAHH